MHRYILAIIICYVLIRLEANILCHSCNVNYATYVGHTLNSWLQRGLGQQPGAQKGFSGRANPNQTFLLNFFKLFKISSLKKQDEKMLVVVEMSKNSTKHIVL